MQNSDRDERQRNDGDVAAQLARGFAEPQQSEIAAGTSHDQSRCASKPAGTLNADVDDTTVTTLPCLRSRRQISCVASTQHRMVGTGATRAVQAERRPAPVYLNCRRFTGHAVGIVTCVSIGCVGEAVAAGRRCRRRRAGRSRASCASCRAAITEAGSGAVVTFTGCSRCRRGRRSRCPRGAPTTGRYRGPLQHRAPRRGPAG